MRLDELGYSDLGDGFEDMKIRAKDHGFNFPYLYDGENQKVSRAYGPVATPHVFVFDRQRKLRFAGRIDNSEKPERVTSHDTRNAIDALLGGQAGAGGEDEGLRLFDQVVRQARLGRADRWRPGPRKRSSLKLIDEKGIRALVKNDGKKLRLINVWATWCGPCVAELPEFVAMNRMYRQPGLRAGDHLRRCARGKGRGPGGAQAEAGRGQQLPVRRQRQVQAHGRRGREGSGPVPHTILVAPGGKVLYRKSGPCEPLAIKRAIVDYLGRTYK